MSARVLENAKISTWVCGAWQWVSAYRYLLVANTKQTDTYMHTYKFSAAGGKTQKLLKWNENIKCMWEKSKAYLHNKQAQEALEECKC